MKIIKHTFYKVSEIEPEVLRHFMINEVGERAKDKLYNYLRDLTESYPDFENWFYNVVIPEVELKDGKREIIIVLSEIEGHSQALLSGLAILKKTKYEKKICTFRIHEDFRNQGIGSELFEKCFEFLKTRKPIITISHYRKKMFDNHIINYNFIETQVLKDYYKQDSIEYVYNGFLVEK
ncbi:GNAT family N-acetyltransferase [Paenibacillus sp. 19GGS1-52]|uniref:GNAT family N-acetyltransferase n=1 Tax=Paenibacillus sp. 19GGS1-52 TaxID=2758563 RepID=UPI001EFACDC2|nr:GNAT family N-acetyltransferase [Paenibacillus sp. 19GGS1-52]ULO07044.1 GNAT family N-acetyltransferase [Paenibacillus sp. 19GGS1-52]